MFCHLAAVRLTSVIMGAAGFSLGPVGGEEVARSQEAHICDGAACLTALLPPLFFFFYLSNQI